MMAICKIQTVILEKVMNMENKIPSKILFWHKSLENPRLYLFYMSRYQLCFPRASMKTTNVSKNSIGKHLQNWAMQIKRLINKLAFMENSTMPN